MKTVYLIDFENVNDVNSLAGCSNFDENVEVHLFYTENVKSINLDITFGDAKEKRHKIVAGNQSVDMHLAVFLGNTIIELMDAGAEDISFVIISKDKGYDNLVKFWRVMGVDVSRKNDVKLTKKSEPKADKTTEKIAEKPATKASSKENTTKKKTTKNNNNLISLLKNLEPGKLDKDKKEVAEKADKPVTKASCKSELNVKVQKLLSEHYDDVKFTNEVASLVVKNFGVDRYTNVVHNALRKQYGDGYLETYNILKPLLSEYAKISKTFAESK